MSKDQNHGLGQAAFPVPMSEFAGDFVPTTIPGMSLRDYAAIHLRVPCSDKEWLNEAIQISIQKQMMCSIGPEAYKAARDGDGYRHEVTDFAFLMSKEFSFIEDDDLVAGFFKDYGE